MIAFVLASVYGGAAGVLYAGLIHYIAPETFSIADMFLLLAMVIIGGRQSLAGCVIGAVGLTVVQQELVNLAAYAQLGYGLVVVAGRGVRPGRPGRDPRRGSAAGVGAGTPVRAAVPGARSSRCRRPASPSGSGGACSRYPTWCAGSAG